MANQMEQQQSHRSILELLGYHGLTYIFLFLLFRSLPYAAAQSNNPSPPSMDPYGFSASFSPTMAIILVVMISAFFFLGFFSIYFRQCTEGRTAGSIRGAGMPRRANRGLDPAVIETFPTFVYSDVKGLKLGKGALECAVCLNEFEDAETIRLLPKCDHVFHPECIDVWLSNRTTCPVCRANLVPVPGAIPTTTLPVQGIEGDLDEEIEGSEMREADNHQISISGVSEEPQVVGVGVAVAVAVAPELINQTPMQNRPTRSKSTSNGIKYAGRFPRSHSTGHSLVQPGENVERFTLRLPDDVRKQIMNKRELQLKRTTSMVAFQREGSSRKGYRMTGEGSSRGGKSLAEKPDSWVFSMTLPFVMRASSSRSPKMTAEGDPTVRTPPPTKPFWSPLRSPLRSPLGGSRKADGMGESLTRPPV